MGDKKQTSTGIIKDFLINHGDFGGGIKDWKRENKEKVDGTDSVVKRIFKNKKNQQEVTVFEVTSLLDATKFSSPSIHTSQNDKLFIFRETKEKVIPVSEMAFETEFETDVEKIKAAEEFIDLIVNDNDLSYNEWTRKQEELIEKCGPVAYFNQMCFVYMPEDEDNPKERHWFITPIEYVKKYSSGYDQCLSRGPWFMESVMAGTFICDPEYQDWSIERVANELMAIGCVFDREYQRELDDRFVNIVPEKGTQPDNKEQLKP